MSDGFVPLEITQGTDWTGQIIWTDNFDEPMPLIAPARMDIKADSGAIVYSLETPDVDPPPGTIPQIALSETTGLIQLHIPKEATAALVPGTYVYDLFVTLSDGGIYAGPQVDRLIVGQVVVNKRVTVMS